MHFIFPSTIIISNNEQKIGNKINEIVNSLEHSIENNPDIFFLQEYTIDQVREIKSFLSKKPFSHNSKIVIIQNIQNLNNESQNALLKILEEPGEGNYLLLSAPNVSSLIPTITSRCQIIKLKTDKSASIKEQLLIVSPDLNLNLLKSEEISKDKEKVIPYLQNQIILYHQELLTNPNGYNSHMILKLQKAIDMINSNVDPKSALDYLFLT